MHLSISRRSGATPPHVTGLPLSAKSRSRKAYSSWEIEENSWVNWISIVPLPSSRSALA